MDAIKLISQDLFDKVRSRFSNLEMGDSMGGVTIDPAEAYYFDFDFIIEGNNLGRVSVSLGELGSLKIYYSQGITENQDDPVKRHWFNFLREMRFFAMRRKLRFDTRDISKNNLDKNDFQQMAATQGPKEEEMNTMNESRWSEKSSRKTSRAIQGKTEVIVRHASPVDETYAGSRSQRKNIRAIFIQNSDGERFKYPFIHPAGAFAMAQHVDHGGTPHDPAGKAIIDMSEQIAKLGEFQRKIHTATLHPDATGITERAVGRLQELKNQVACLSKRQHYQNWMAEFQEPQDPVLSELDAVTMEDYKSKFTQTSFQEELAAYFPILHRVMSETNTVDLESYVNETDVEEDEEDTEVKESVFDAFEEWANATESGEITDDQVTALADAIAKLPQGNTGPELALGDNGGEAADFFASYGLDDMDLQQKLKDAANGDSDTDPFSVLKSWAEDEHNYPGLMQRIGIQGDEAPAEQPPEAGAEQPPEAGAEQPPAEGDDEENEKPQQAQGSMFEEIAKLVGGRFNRDNMDLGAFNGKENIALEVKKEIAEQFGDDAGALAEQLALKFMEKLSMERDHGQVQDDGLSMDRLRELMGNVKAKFEAVHGEETNEGFGGETGPLYNSKGKYLGKWDGQRLIIDSELWRRWKDENGQEWADAVVHSAKDKIAKGLWTVKSEGDAGQDNWHPSKHVDPQKQKELAPHAPDVNRGSYADRAAYMKAGGVPDDRGPQEEGILDKAKAFGKKVLDKVAPDDDELLRRLQKDSGVPAHAQHGKPPMATPNRRQQQENTEFESILKLSGLAK